MKDEAIEIEYIGSTWNMKIKEFIWTKLDMNESPDRKHQNLALPNVRVPDSFHGITFCTMHV